MKNICKFPGALFLLVLVVSPVWATPVQGVGVARQNLVPFSSRAPKFIETRHENFNSGHGWVNNGGSEGNFVDDTSIHINNDRSIKITTGGSGGGTWIFGPALSPKPDVSNANLVVRVRIENSSLINNLFFWAFTDASNYMFWSLSEHSTIKEGFMDGEWLTISLSPGDFVSEVGTFNPASIDHFQISLSDTGVSATSVWVGAIGSFPQQPKGKVVLMFDDTHDEGYTEAMKKMSQSGMVGSADINPFNVGTLGRMTVAQLRELQDVHGWEISLQVNGDITQKTGQGIEDFLNTGRKWMIDNNLTSGIQHYAYSGGFYNAAVLPTIRKYFKTARTAGPGLNVETYPAGDWHLLSTFSGVDTTPLSAYTGAVDQAIAGKELLVFTFHEIVATTTGGSQISIANFGTFIDDLAAHVAAGNIDVVTMGQAVNDLN